MNDAEVFPDEVPAFFPSGEDDIFGVLTRPVDQANGYVALLLWLAAGLPEGGLPSFGKNRVRTALARRLAADGYHVMRIDCGGSGESTGAPPEFHRDDPVPPEVFAAVEWLRHRQLVRLVSVGSGFGALTALGCAARAPGVSGLVLLSPPLLDNRAQYEAELSLRAGGSPEWIDARTLADFRRAIANDIPVLLVYGTLDWLYPVFERARHGPFGHLLEEAGSLVTVRIVDGLLHNQVTVAGQLAMIETVVNWLAQLPQTAPRTGRPYP